MRKYAVIVAGGSGNRMGGGIPKQFRSLCGHPVLWWSMKAFHDEDPQTEIILVLPRDFINLWEDFFSSLPEPERFGHKITAGGATRGESVRNGLSLIEDTEALVAVHDGARPLVTPGIIQKGWQSAMVSGAAIPVIPVVDSLRKICDAGSKAIDRKDYVAVQTPQVFKTGSLMEAYYRAGDRSFTDDASVAENAGMHVELFDGSPDNIKITNPRDMVLATLLMSKDA